MMHTDGSLMNILRSSSKLIRSNLENLLMVLDLTMKKGLADLTQTVV